MIVKGLDGCLNSNNLTLAEFGEGNIAIGGFVATALANEQKYAIVTMTNTFKKEEIGKCIKAEKEQEKGFYDIVLSFNKPESMDVLIGVLTELKVKL
jgi:hypothetical protein